MERGLLVRGSRVVIPASLTVNILDKIHTGHQGITKCRERAKHSLVARVVAATGGTSQKFPRMPEAEFSKARTTLTLLFVSPTVAKSGNCFIRME